MEWLSDVEFGILDFIQANFKNGFMDVLNVWISGLGGAIIWIAIGLLLCFFKKLRGNGTAIILAVLFSMLVSEFVIKPFILRDRPFLFNLDVVLLVDPPFGTSFPSSHTILSFAAAIQFFYINKWAGIGAIVFAVMVAFSRLYLYVHFPTDILCGIIIGVIFGFIIHFLVKFLTEREKLKKFF